MNSFCINESISSVLVIEPHYPFLVFLSWHNFHFYPFLFHTYLLVPWATTVKSLGMAHGARLLVTVGRGGVRSVGSKNRVT